MRMVSDARWIIAGFCAGGAWGVGQAGNWLGCIALAVVAVLLIVLDCIKAGEAKRRGEIE